MNTTTVQQLHDDPAATLVDVREIEEFAAGHVPGAVNMPMSGMGEHLDDLPDGPFAVICHLGSRSARVVEALDARGYLASNVDGGTDAWIAAGYPLEH